MRRWLTRALRALPADKLLEAQGNRVLLDHLDVFVVGANGGTPKRLTFVVGGKKATHSHEPTGSVCACWRLALPGERFLRAYHAELVSLGVGQDGPGPNGLALS